MTWVDFKEVKGLVTMKMLLDHYRVPIPFGSRAQLYNLPCPFPAHSAQNKKSLNVNLDRNIWSCKSDSCIANRDGEGGNVLDFVRWMEQTDLKGAAQQIVEWFGTKEASSNGKTSVSKTENVGPIPTASATEHNLVEWLENLDKKTPPNNQAEVRADNPSQPDHKSSAVAVKGFMRSVDDWFDPLISDPPDWKKIKNAIKGKLLESYNNGKTVSK